MLWYVLIRIYLETVSLCYVYPIGLPKKSLSGPEFALLPVFDALALLLDLLPLLGTLVPELLLLHLLHEEVTILQLDLTFPQLPFEVLNILTS